MSGAVDRIWEHVTDDKRPTVDVDEIGRRTLREARAGGARDDDYDVLTHDREAWGQLIRLGWDEDDPDVYTWKITPTGYIGEHREYPTLEWDCQQWMIGPDPGYEGFALGEVNDMERREVVSVSDEAEDMLWQMDTLGYTWADNFSDESRQQLLKLGFILWDIETGKIVLSRKGRQWVDEELHPMYEVTQGSSHIETDNADEFYYRNEPEMESLLGDLTRSLDAVHTFVMERSATDPSTVDTIVDEIVDVHIEAWKSGNVAKV